MADEHTAAQRAGQELRKMLDVQEFRPGDRLPPATELSRQLGFSRPVVLQALKILEGEGRLSITPGRAGTRVLEPGGPHRAQRLAWIQKNRDVIREMVVLRQIIEPGIVHLLARQELPDSSMRKLWGAQKRATEAENDRHEYLLRDGTFHHELARQTGISAIEEVYEMVRRWVAPTFDIVNWEEDRPAHSSHEHAAILDAIERADPSAAFEEMHRHVATSAESVLAQLTGRASSDTAERVQPYGQVQSAKEDVTTPAAPAPACTKI